MMPPSPTELTMRLELDTPTENRWFASMMLLDEPSPRESRTASRRREDTSMEVLAHEIMLYMPELAHALATSGGRKLRAA
ncbi:MAG: hypothetical protein JWO94_1696 [Verrucomicrobiaceae bacterium]|nr:hypothetical protein [Verrucomicrobiaceae bacterium]